MGVGCVRFQGVEAQEVVLLGKMIICPAMNINLLFVGGASIFARSSCDVILQESAIFQSITST